MTNFILGVFVGAVVVDFAWGWKFGLPQMAWYNFKRFCKKWLTF